MMKIKSVFLCMAAATMIIVGCSKSEIEGTTITHESDEIVLKSNVTNVEATSRTAYEGSITNNNPLTALVLATTNNYSSLRCYGSMIFSGSTTGTAYQKPVTGGIANGYKFPGSGVDVYLTGLHPATGWTGFTGATTDGTLSFNLTGKDDVMFAPQVTTEMDAVAGNSYQTLTFAHQLTLMKLSLSCDNDADGKINIQSIELIKACKADLNSVVTATLNGTQGVAFSAPQTASSLPCYTRGTDTAYSFDTGSEYLVLTTASEQAYVIAPPVMASDVTTDPKEYTFRINYLDGTDAKTKDVDIDLKGTDGSTLFNGTTANRAFNITLRFVGGEIVTNATVTDWVVGGTFTQDV